MWFVFVKTKFPDAHISWAFRDEKNQNEAFDRGLSKVRWPNSKHNYMENGAPMSKALDLFKINEAGAAQWPVDWFHEIYTETEKESHPIKWGGTFRSIKDYDHFELS
jgi:hypothetical protein